MWRATLSSLAAHKVRLALTTLAIVLGVSFVSGTLIYTDTVRSSFDAVFGQVTSKVDLNVRGLSELDDTGVGGADAGFGGVARQVSPATADRIADVDGVAAIERNVEGIAQLLDDRGQPIGSGQGPPALGFNAPTVQALDPTELRDGRYPTASDEVALDAATARTNGFEVGETIQIAAGGPVDGYRLVGTFGFGDDVDSMAGASVTLFEPEAALELFSLDGGYANVDVLAAEDADVADLRHRIAAVAGDGYEVVTGDELAADTQQTLDSILGIFNTALLVFAGVSLLVGAFIINNTFAIIVAQRSRELALLRAVGASRAQVLGSVLLEAFVVGLTASVVGVGLGAGVAMALRSLLSAFGIELPDTELVFAVRTGLVGVALGVVVTFLSALLPATKALRVPPVAAMQAVAAPLRRGRGLVRTGLGLVVLATGVALLGLGLFGEASFPIVISGAVALLLGAALLARFVTRPLLAIIGWPVGRLGVRGTLARENAVRNPGRTASTASALMIGLGLVTFALIFGASIRESTTRTIDEQFVSDLQIRSGNFQPMDADVDERIAALPEVATVADMRLGQVAVDGNAVGIAAVEPSELGSAWSFEVTDGDLEDFERSGGLLVSADAAEELGVRAGDPLEVGFAQGGEEALPVRALIDGETSNYFIDERTYLSNAPDEGPFTLYVSLADGVSVDQARAAIENATTEYPTLNVQDGEDLRAEIAGQVDQILGLMSALLGLSILIALFGITNTLSLSVFERVRELGLLRAVGATRGQVRSMVRWESVLIAVLGAAFGIVVGTVFGWMTVRALAEQGFSAFAFPTVQVVLAVVVAALAGMLAAVLPARRAARVDILRALAST